MSEQATYSEYCADGQKISLGNVRPKRDDGN